MAKEVSLSSPQTEKWLLEERLHSNGIRFKLERCGKSYTVK